MERIGRGRTHAGDGAPVQDAQTILRPGVSGDVDPGSSGRRKETSTADATSMDGGSSIPYAPFGRRAQSSPSRAERPSRAAGRRTSAGLESLVWMLRATTENALGGKGAASARTRLDLLDREDPERTRQARGSCVRFNVHCRAALHPDAASAISQCRVRSWDLAYAGSRPEVARNDSQTYGRRRSVNWTYPCRVNGKCTDLTNLRAAIGYSI